MFEFEDAISNAMSNLAAFIEGIDSLEPPAISCRSIDVAALRSLRIICIRELTGSVKLLAAGRIEPFVTSLSTKLCEVVTRNSEVLIRLGNVENTNSGRDGQSWSQLSFLINTVLSNTNPPEPLSPALRFSLCILHNDAISAAELVQELITALNDDVASALSTITMLKSTKRPHALQDLQQILTLLDHAGCASIHSANTQAPSTDSSIFTDRVKSHMLRQLRGFISHYPALVPSMAVTVRNAVLQSALFTNQRYDIVSAVLSEPISTSSLDALYMHLSSLRSDAAADHDTERERAGTDQQGAVAESSTGLPLSSASAADRAKQGEQAPAPGHEYHRNISREEAIKVLYPLPEGSFLLRPHETVPEQLYLSFRTGHSGRVTSGKDAVVKHAIIRRTAPERTGQQGADSADGNSTGAPANGKGGGGSVSSAGTEAEVAEGSASPLPAALRSPLPSSAALPTLPTRGEEEGDCAYVCGKLGPFPNLLSLLKEISSVLENPLRFAPIGQIHSSAMDSAPHSPPRSPLRAGHHSGGAKEGNAGIGVPALQSLDLNFSLWKRLGSCVSALAGASQRMPSSASVAAALPAEVDAWRVADRFGLMGTKYRQIVQLLVLSEYLRQLGPAVDLCNALVRPGREQPDDPSSDGGGASGHSESKGDGSLYYRKFSSGAHGRCCSQPFTGIFRQFHRYIQESETALQAFLLPTGPLHAWCAPRMEYVVRGSVPSPRGGDSSPSPASSSANVKATVFAPEDELLVAEHLLHLLSTSAGTKNIRLTSTSGTEHVVLPRCVPVEETHKLLEAWREMYIQHESQVTQRLAARRLAERRTNKADSAGAVTGEESSQVDPRADYETAIVSQSTSTTDTTLSVAAYSTLRRVEALLQMDITCSAKDYIRRVIAWLSDELQLVYEVSKPGDYAFSAAQRFYCPRHPWEVRVLRDFTQAGERVKLGRNTYTSASPDDGARSGSSADLLSTCRSEYFTRSVASAIMHGVAAGGAGGTGGSAASREEAFWGLWSTLGAEQYLHSVVSCALPSALREDTPDLFPVPSTGSTATASSKPERSPHSVYTATLEHYLHRNCLSARLGLLQRTVPLVQLDVYGIQEILAVRTISTSLHAPVAIPSGVSPMTYMSMFNKPTVLSPTTTTHAAAALDIYAVMQLAHRTGAHSMTGPSALTTSHKGSTASSGTSSPAVKKATGPLTAKNCSVGSVVTSVHKAEARRTPLEQSDNAAAGSAAGESGSAVNNLVPNAWYTQQQQGITRAVEYSWRDQALFRFPLPEGQHSVSCPAAVTPTLLQAHGGEASTSAVAAVTAVTAVTAAFPPTALPIPLQYFEPPNTLVIAVYERTFFSDTLLGELELDLTPLNGKKMIRGWYPLVLDRAISWLVYVQVRLKLQDLYLEPPGAQARNSAALAMAESGFGSAGGSAREASSGAAGKGQQQGGAGMSANIIKQMDDFY